MTILIVQSIAALWMIGLVVSIDFTVVDKTDYHRRLINDI